MRLPQDDTAVWIQHDADASFVPCFEAKALNPSPPDGGLLLIRSDALQIKIRLIIDY
jgi:hypothetical protein